MSAASSQGGFDEEDGAERQLPDRFEASDMVVGLHRRQSTSAVVQWGDSSGSGAHVRFPHLSEPVGVDPCCCHRRSMPSLLRG